MTQNAEDVSSFNFLTGLEDVSWTPSTQTPSELRISNMRRRGIDEYRISLPPNENGKVKRALFGLPILTGKPAIVQAITIVGTQLRFTFMTSGKRTKNDLVVECKDVDAIVISPGSSKSNPHIIFAYGNARRDKHSGYLEFGAGLPDSVLIWLRDRLLLETAGLVSRPLYNVGGRSTRQTINPDEKHYLAWTSGSNRLIDIFLVEAPEKFSAFRAAVEAQAWVDAAKHVHWLKSSSAAVAAGYLSQSFQRIEIELQNRDPAAVKALVKHVVSEFAEAALDLGKIQGGKSLEGAEDKPRTSDDSTQPFEQAFPGSRILVVEDSLVNQELAREFLECMGCTVDCVGTGEDALNQIERMQYDLILMDCQMPGMGGLEATRLIRKSEMLEGRPNAIVIALTAHTLRDDRNKCLAAGMNDHLGKPYTAEELFDVLNRWLNAAEAVDAGVSVDETSDTTAPAATTPPTVLAFIPITRSRGKRVASAKPSAATRR